MSINYAELLAGIKSETKPVSPAASTKDILFGSGLTKRIAEQAEKEQERKQAKDYRVVDIPVLTPELSASILPSTMMDQNIILDEDQAKAVTGLQTQQFGCLIGAAGTGKTTTTKALIATLERQLPMIDMNRAKRPDDRTENEQNNIAVCFCAFTGKAVQNIKRALPKAYHPLCDTIHGTLGYAPVIEEYQDKKTKEWKERKVFRPTFTTLNKLPFKLVIVDESSMVPIFLWNQLIAALSEDCRVMLIGDINQLPPVQGRSVFGFAMLKWPTYALTKLHRQAAGDSIAVNAHRILNGQLPTNCAKKFIIQNLPDGSLSAFQTTIGVIQHLHQAGKFDPLRDALIVPKNIGNLGQLAFNERLVGYFNPLQKINDIPINPRIIIKAGYKHISYAVGDKIMLLANDRQLGLTNGMVGVIEEIKPNVKFKNASGFNSDGVDDVFDLTMDEFAESINIDTTNKENNNENDDAIEKTTEEETERQASHIVTCRFQNIDEPVEFDTSGAFNKITHAYAFTCHKSQGGEYPTVVIVCHASDLMMLTREWLYTAVTRAQERVILLINSRGLLHAINNQRIKGTTIQDKIQKFIELETENNAGFIDVEMPVLPEPQNYQQA